MIGVSKFLLLAFVETMAQGKKEKKSKSKAAGKLRWGKEERELCYKYFAGLGKKAPIDIDKLISSADYCDEIHELEALWGPFINKKFNQNIRRHATEWKANEELRAKH